MMKVTVILLIDTQQPGKLTQMGQYDSLDQAKTNLHEVALAHVVKEEGEKHRENAFQDKKTLEEVRADYALRGGLYLKTDGDLVYVYQKTETKKDRAISTNMVPLKYTERTIEQVGYFCVTEIKVDFPSPPEPPDIPSPPPLYDSDEEETESTEEPDEK